MLVIPPLLSVIISLVGRTFHYMSKGIGVDIKEAQVKFLKGEKQFVCIPLKSIKSWYNWQGEGIVFKHQFISTISRRSGIFNKYNYILFI